MKTISPTPSPGFDARRAILQHRVNEAASALHTQGQRPTVTRIRIALGGGSPNDLTPALKYWKEVEFPKIASKATGHTPTPPPLPLHLAELSQELWQRALAAAVLEVKSGTPARDLAARTAEIQSLREQLSSLRDQLQRESVAYGELRAQATRHEVIAREALSREQATASRERGLIREVGSLRERIVELEAVLLQHQTARSRPARKKRSVSARSKDSHPTPAARNRKLKTGTRRKRRSPSRRA